MNRFNTTNDLSILGIETSCDETGAAVYNTINGLQSYALYSQIALHASTGGVIPEVASRSQLEKIRPVIDEAIAQSSIPLSDIDVIAVTHKPGLPGSLLVGVTFAKALAWALNKQLIGINHLEGHVFSSFIEHQVPFPHLCLTASGGHTSLYIVHDFGVYTQLGTTRDDAAGEAFDKIAKLVGLPYPGGPAIEKSAEQVSFNDFFKYPRSTIEGFDFSFSGLKTAVLYDLVNKGWYILKEKKSLIPGINEINQVASSLLVCIADIFIERILKAIKHYPEIKAVTFVGGVACNKYIASRLRDTLAKYNKPLFIPSPRYCTDNGAMIAFVGAYKALQNQYSDLTLDILK